MSNVIDFMLCGGIPLVRAKAGDCAGWFAFDTGAMRTTLNRAYFPKLELGEQLEIYKYDGDVKDSGACSCTIPRLRVGALNIAPLEVLCMDMSYVENALRTQEPDIEFLGSIGIDVIGAHDVLLDYTAKTITFDPGARLGACHEVPLTMGKLPLISCSLGGKDYRFVLDTGASACLVGQDVAKQLALKPSEAPPHLCELPRAVIGRHAYDGMQAVISDMTAIRAKTDADGVIGYQLLGRQRSMLGFRSGKLQLENGERQM